MKNDFLYALTVAFVATLIPHFVEAQRTTFAYSVGCQSCGIVLMPLTTLGIRESLDHHVNVVMDNQRRLIAASADGKTLVVYDSTGIRTGRYRAPGGVDAILIGVGTTVKVVNGNKVMRVTADTIGAGVKLPEQWTGGVGLPGSIVMSGRFTSGTVLVASDSGTVNKTFRLSRNKVFRPQISPGSNERHFWITGDSAVESHSLKEFAIDAPNVEREIVISASPWYNSTTHIDLAVLREDSVGRIWTRLWISPAPRNGPAPGGFEVLQGDEVIAARQQQHSGTTVIELIDPSRKRIEVSQTFDLKLERVDHSELLVSRRIDNSGKVLIDVWRPVVIRR